MFARSASLAVMALLGLHGIDMVDAKVLIGGSSLPGLRAQAGTPAPSASPVSPQPTLPVPTGSPSDSPAPSPAPSDSPTVKPPTTSPSASPAPSPSPSSTPTLTKMPTPFPTSGPPTVAPVVTAVPSASPKPSPSPSGSPSTPAPTTTPSDSPQPSPGPTRNTPTGVPTKTLAPSGTPTMTAAPSPGPSASPSKKGSEAPSKSPMPSESPSASPKPSPSPSLKPTVSKMPTPGPTAVPTVSNEPSSTTVPSMTSVPSLEPSFSSEPSVSDVPSAFPSFSDEPSISDVPTTSANPTNGLESYVDLTITFQGITTLAITTFTVPAGVVCIDPTGATITAVATVTGTTAAPNTINVRCTEIDTTDATPYTFTVVQTTINDGNGGPNTFFPYTVDFKVAGDTVTELSGVMQPVATPPLLPADAELPDTRTFTFINNDPLDAPANEVTETELSPAKGGNFIEFVLASDPDVVDTHIVTPLAQPLGIDDAIACGLLDIAVALVAEVPGVTATDPPVTAAVTLPCSFYAVDTPGAPEYQFLVDIQSGAGLALTPFDLNIESNGVVIPGGPTVGTAFTNSIFQLLTFRADSGDGPLVLVPTPAVFELKATWTTVGTTVTLSDDSAGNDCLVSAPFTSTAAGPNTVSIFCRTYGAGTMVGLSSAVTGTPGTVDYEFFYLGVPDPLLSTSSAAAAVTFAFTPVGVEGDALTLQTLGP